MLTLPIKQKWFDMIVSGEKQEEYRAPSEYWRKRFVSELVRQSKQRGFNGLKVRIRAGYQKDADLAELTLSMITTGTGRPEWGAEPGVEYFVLHIKRVEVVKP